MTARMKARTARADSGQAAVETALVLPLMVFLALGIVQLTSVQHAKLMTEYAAYQAARAGIVWNGSNERMHDAAFFALLPTLGSTESTAKLASTYSYARGVDAELAGMDLGRPEGDLPSAFDVRNLLGLVRVDTVNPALYSDIKGFWNLPEHDDWKELEFDGPDTYPQSPEMEENFDKFFTLDQEDPRQEQYRRATVLSIRLRYFYEMKIPFASWIIFTAWYAANSGVSLHGAIDRPTVDANVTVTNKTTHLDALRGQGRGLKHEKGFASVTPGEMTQLWDISTTGLPRYGKKFYLPLTATYSMRMQSNFYRKWIMHESPSWGL